MRSINIKLLLLCVFGYLLSVPGLGAIAVADGAETTTSPAEIETVIKTLEDPASREELIRQLKIMAGAQGSAAPESQVKSAASQALRDISRRLKGVKESVMALTDDLREIHRGIVWFKNGVADPHSRRQWSEVLVNLTLTLGLGYLAFYLLRWGLRRFRRVVAEKPTDHLLLRALRLLGVFCLDLLPPLAFGVAAYLTLGLITPPEKTTLVALAWVNAVIVAHGIVALCHFIFAPSAPGLRLSGLSDAGASHLLFWGKRLGHTTVYGYFSLQAALLLGLPQLSYEVLLRLLGLLVAGLVSVMILHHREVVTRYLHQWPARECVEADGHQSALGVRNRLARTWHLLALFYVLLLYGIWALQVVGGVGFLVRATLLTLGILVVIRLARRLLDSLFSHGLRINEELKNRFSSLEERSNRILRLLRRALHVVLYFLAAMSILEVWGVNTFAWLTGKQGRVLGGTLVAAFGILLVTFLIWEIVNTLIEGHLVRVDQSGREVEASPRTRTLLAVARKALSIVLAVVATLMVLSEIGIDIAPLLAGAGVLGLAVGFGSQKLVQDVITGVFILLEDQIAVGDVVNVGDRGGVVEAVSIRTVRLRDLSGTVHTIPFSAITIVSNLTKDFSYYVLEVGVAYREDVDEVMQVLRDIGAELQQDEEYGPTIIEPLEMLGVDAFADSAVVIKARLKTTPIKQWGVGREFNRRMKKRFDELGIEIPFPHTTVYFGENKEAAAPPARLRIETISRGDDEGGVRP